MPIHRIEVRTKPQHSDTRAMDLQRSADSTLNISPAKIQTADVYLIDDNCHQMNNSHLQLLCDRLLTDPVTQYAVIDDTPPSLSAKDYKNDNYQIIEIHPLPGVTDPVAHSVEMSILELLKITSAVRTGTRYDIHGINPNQSRQIATRLLANPVIHSIHHQPHHPESFPTGHEQDFIISSIPICRLDDNALIKLSRDAHLFLSLEEMQTIQNYYKKLNREPRDIELETLAQTWSEHCVHKTLKSTIIYQGILPENPIKNNLRPGQTINPDGTITINNLLKSTIAAATRELMNDGADQWCLSVFVDNAGIIAFDDDTAVCFKVETHNHPSALEPYGGAATGIGGCIRDIIGTGLAAKPVASTDIFCVAYPDIQSQNIPAGCLHPRRILTRIVAGVRDYGNRMGIPTVNGSVYFDDRYIGNPLVYCGSIGVMPRNCITGTAKPGDHIIVLGGATGRDGIHGATFSSAELTDTHSDEFSHAVQIGDPITEKKMLDAILKARDHNDGFLYNAITDCGAGGFSSAVGEMGEQLGANVNLEKAPLKYAGLTYTEIWISEAQERMVLAVPAENISKIEDICKTENVDWCDIGTFGTPNSELILNYNNTEVGHLSMNFLHEGIPMPVREAIWNNPKDNTSSTNIETNTTADQSEISDILKALLSHPNIASKHWIIRQYDHEVQGQAVINPLVGKDGAGPSDAAVITPKLNSNRGLAIANGLTTEFSSDPYWMTLAAVDECVRNLVCVGANPSRIAILDNFCWPSCNKPENMGSLVRAAIGGYDAAKAYKTPFISGKDSLNNQFTTNEGTTIEIPPTLLISGFGIVDDIQKCITMDAKQSDNLLIIVGNTATDSMGGSHLALLSKTGKINLNNSLQNSKLPETDLKTGPATAAAVANLISKGLVQSAHDCSEGGLLVAASEMAFAGNIGLHLNLKNLPVTQSTPPQVNPTDSATFINNQAFNESPSRYLLEIKPADLLQITTLLANLPWAKIGQFNKTQNLTLETTDLNITLNDLFNTWHSSLDW